MADCASAPAALKARAVDDQAKQPACNSGILMPINVVRLSPVERQPQSSSLPRVQRIAAILWPSFLLSIAATGVFFSVFDPYELFSCQGEPPLSRISAYSVGFFLFWLLTAGSSLLTVYFLRPCELVNPQQEL